MKAWQDTGKVGVHILALIQFSCLVGLGQSDRLFPALSFEGYKAKFNRSYAEDSEEYRARKALYDSRLVEIGEHNAAGRAWKMGINHLVDWTEDELKKLRGYKPVYKSRKSTGRVAVAMRRSSLIGLAQSVGSRHSRHGSRHSGVGTSCSSHNGSCLVSLCCDGLICGASGRCDQAGEIPSELDWSAQLPTGRDIPDQGGCGSCWAFAAASVIEMQAQILSEKKFQGVLSPQNIISCTPNPLECGGTGGCDGATSELAFQWAGSTGGRVDLAAKQPYVSDQGDSGTCMAGESNGTSLLGDSSQNAVKVRGYHKLTPNNGLELMNALVNVGPVAISLAAGGLFFYESGIFTGSGTPDDWIVDHAVVAMGYGQDATMDNMLYWKIRNSWSGGWGEEGFFRLLRHPPGEEPCGVDTDPSKGSACKDQPGGSYPTEQKVCGVCGMLADSSYPLGAEAPPALYTVF
eukprot:TRINITY_DN9847_c0_g1_i1.p1 TRINITY_DN9847_c0_g1~~TRINITY_DN9847_c0_g1_i1.p1  ORF type:complete len:461 (+),score=50.46 TRINITY_DN9847_c0_g1_i1:89-1471(+)